FGVVLLFSLAMASTARGGSMFSNVSVLERLSCNIFLTNFPAKLSAKELWNTCAQYGTVLDVYIPRKLSKQGKPFAFVRFNKGKTSTVVKGNGTQESLAIPMMVLEHGSLNFEGDPVLVGCVKDFKIIPNIYNVCSSKGFKGIKSSYLGGFWVLFEFDSFQSCKKFQSHDEINSWFSCLQQWDINFVISNRVVWIDVEGTPLQAWSLPTFNKITSKWGELVYMDDSNVTNKYSMCLCVKTKIKHLIAESFKVITGRKVFVLHAK
nr:hypothetical protein [Tanacetum cinerariifolium]